MEKVKAGRFVKDTFVTLARDAKALLMSGVVCVGVLGTLGGLTALQFGYARGISDALDVVGGLLLMSVVVVFMGSPWFVGGLAAMLTSGKTKNVTRLPLLLGYSATIGVLNIIALGTWGLLSHYIHARYATLTPSAMTGGQGIRAGGERALEAIRPHTWQLFAASWALHIIYIVVGVAPFALVAVTLESNDWASAVSLALFMVYCAMYPLIIGAFQLAVFKRLMGESSASPQ